MKEESQLLGTVSRLVIYPVKALDGISVNSARVLPMGALEHDRQFAMTNRAGKYFNGKNTPRVHLLESRFDFPERVFWVGLRNSVLQPFQVDEQRDQLEAWLSEFFGEPVQWNENPDGGFPDDEASPGFTVISTESLEQVSHWFPAISRDELRERFRANVELRVAEPFAEDRLFADVGQKVGFRVGEVEMLGINPCARCIVPSRHPQNGESTPLFPKQFAQQRRHNLPGWVAGSRFDHFYRLAINTRRRDEQELTGKDLAVHVGDQVWIEGLVTV